MFHAIIVTITGKPHRSVALIREMYKDSRLNANRMSMHHARLLPQEENQVQGVNQKVIPVVPIQTGGNKLIKRLFS